MPSSDKAWTFEAATVRSGRVDDLKALIRMLFQRRTLPHLKGWAKTWQVKELVRDLRAASVAYDAASSDVPPPAPFALAHLRIRDNRLEPIASHVPINDAELIARILSEFLEPGAILQVGAGRVAQRWKMKGIDDVVRLPAVSSAPED